MVGTDLFGSTNNKKNKRPQQGWENPVEAWRDLPNALGNTAKQEAKNIAADTFKQLLSLEQDVKKLSGDLTAGQSIDFAQMEQSKMDQPDYPDYPKVETYRQPGIDYHREFRTIQERIVVEEDTRQIHFRIEQIIGELRKLTASSSELEVQFKDVVMEETPVEPGQYHLNFFEWVFSTIQKARERIEESQTWLSLFKNKKAQKGYWNMFKKHGTTFGLSGERVVSTQTG